MNRPPASVVNGSIQRTRQWVADRKKAEKVAKSTRSSVPELQGALSMMRAYL
jgi:O-acetyl-ADP-ribose deacetylase (regulator of RNase III)